MLGEVNGRWPLGVTCAPVIAVLVPVKSQYPKKNRFVPPAAQIRDIARRETKVTRIESLRFKQNPFL